MNIKSEKPISDKEQDIGYEINLCIKNDKVIGIKDYMKINVG